MNIRHGLDFQVVGAALVGDLKTFWVGGENRGAVVDDRIDVEIFEMAQKFFSERVWDYVAVNFFAGSQVDNDAAVVGEEHAVEFFHGKLLGDRNETGGWSAGSQYQNTAFFLRPQKCRLSFGADFFVAGV